MVSAILFWHIRAVRDLPDQPLIDKQALVGRCARLPLSIDAERIAAEVDALDPAVWDIRGGAHRYPQKGVHRAAETVFLRGYTPAEGDLPIEDRPTLDELPYIRQLIERDIGSRPQRCLLARLPARVTVNPHIDRGPYFSKTLRIHVPVVSHDRAWMMCEDIVYLMKPGEAWALNNTKVHGVWNAHPSRERIHMICDFLPDPALLDLLARGERELGRSIPEIDAHFANLSREQPTMAG